MNNHQAIKVQQITDNMTQEQIESFVKPVLEQAKELTGTDGKDKLTQELTIKLVNSALAQLLADKLDKQDALNVHKVARTTTIINFSK